MTRLFNRGPFPGATGTTIKSADTEPARDPHEDAVESQVAAERARGIGRAVAHLVAGRPGLAEYEMARTLRRQLRHAGISEHDVAVPCACGGRCADGMDLR